MSALEWIMSTLCELTGATEDNIAPSTYFNVLFANDDYLRMEFFFRVDIAYNLEFLDNASFEELVVGGTWSIKQLADYIDFNSTC